MDMETGLRSIEEARRADAERSHRIREAQRALKGDSIRSPGTMSRAVAALRAASAARREAGDAPQPGSADARQSL